MKRFAAFETSALTARLARLTRTEEDLRTRIAARVTEVEERGGWIATDALHQHLTGILSTGRMSIEDTREAVGRRQETPARARASRPAAVEA